MNDSAVLTRNDWKLPLALIALTFASTFFVGARMVHGGMPVADLLAPARFVDGWVFALPLMAILLAHEFGHFVAGQRHGVDISPPYFIPMPVVLFGTFGAIIRMRGIIRTRNALLDVGAAGPLAGMVVAIPVLVYGIATSPIEPIPEGQVLLIEGRSLLYLGLLYALKGPIPAGQDIMLTPTALAGWAGLLVTMINLIPIGQLDGGHVAYALLGPRQNRVSEALRRSLVPLGVGVGCVYAAIGYWVEGHRGEQLENDLFAGAPWLVWALVLWLMTRAAGTDHPPTGSEPLSPRRRLVAIGTLALFVLLFMPAWLRVHMT